MSSPPGVPRGWRSRRRSWCRRRRRRRSPHGLLSYIERNGRAPQVGSAAAAGSPLGPPANESMSIGPLAAARSRRVAYADDPAGGGPVRLDPDGPAPAPAPGGPPGAAAAGPGGPPGAPAAGPGGPPGAPAPAPGGLPGHPPTWAGADLTASTLYEESSRTSTTLLPLLRTCTS